MLVKDWALESAITGIAISTIDGKMIYVNDVLVKMWGYDNKEEILGRSLPEFWGGENVHETIDNLRKKGSRIGEDIGKRKDGSLFDVQVSASVIKDEAGNPMCMFGSFLDITERKKAEKDLLVKDWALESAITGIGITTLDGEVIYVNDALVRMWGYENKEEMLGRSLPEFWGGEEVRATIEELREKGSRIGEDIGKRKDGSFFDVLVSSSVIQDDAGNPMCMFGSFLDITERKKAEIELRVKDSALASAIIAVGITTVDGKLIYINDALVEMWGYENKEEILGRDLPELWEGDGIFETIRALHEKGSKIGEDFGKRKDGSLFDVEFSASMIKDNDGNPMYMFGSFLDITDRKTAEESLRQMALLPQLNPDPVLRFDSNGTIRLYNEASVEILGDVIRRDAKLKDVLPGLSHIDLKRCIDQGLVLSEEVRIKDKYYQFVIRGVADLGLGQLYGSDITERKKAENALKKAHGELEGRVFQRTMELAGTNQELKSEIAERKAAEKALARELETSRHRQAEVSALLEGSRVVLEHHTFEEAARKLFDSCKALTGATAGYVALLNDDDTENNVLFLESGDMACSVDPSLPMPNRGLRRKVYETGQPAYENNFAESKWMKLMPVGHVRLDNVLFAPMKIKGRTVGLLGLGNKPGGFNETDAKMAGAFAELAAVALNNSRTLGALRTSQKDLSRARDHLEELVEERTAELQKTNRDLEKQIARRRKAGQELEDKQKQLKTLTSELALAEERERRRIAVGIHDNIGQKMALAKLELQSSMTSPGDSRITESLESVCARIDEAIKETHSLTFELSNPALYELSFDAAIEQWLFEQIQKKQNIKCEVTANVEPVELGVNLKVVLFQAIRELAVNVVKYASADSLSVKISKGKDRIVIKVKDDGVGFVPSNAGPPTSDEKGGFGLFNIRERLEHLGGTMKIKSAPKKGTTIRLTVPLDQQ